MYTMKKLINLSFVSLSMALLSNNALFIGVLFLTGFALALVFGVGNIMFAAIDSSVQSALSPAEYQHYQHFGLTQARTGFESLIAGVFDFAVALFIIFTLYSSINEPQNVSSYIMNFFLGCFASILVIYVSSNLYTIATTGAYSYIFDISMIPGWFNNNFIFILQLNVLAGLCSFAYLYLKRGGQPNAM